MDYACFIFSTPTPKGPVCFNHQAQCAEPYSYRHILTLTNDSQKLQVRPDIISKYVQKRFLHDHDHCGVNPEVHTSIRKEHHSGLKHKI